MVNKKIAIRDAQRARSAARAQAAAEAQDLELADKLARLGFSQGLEAPAEGAPEGIEGTDGEVPAGDNVAPEVIEVEPLPDGTEITPENAGIVVDANGFEHIGFLPVDEADANPDATEDSGEAAAEPEAPEAAEVLEVAEVAEVTEVAEEGAAAEADGDPEAEPAVADETTGEAPAGAADEAPTV